MSSLKVHNSLVKEHLDDFVHSGPIKWYSCGPTVYDDSHLGHARTYLSTDIFRRILEDYFGYQVIQCMNITDVDDKIINKARKTLLVEKYVSENPLVNKEVIVALQTAWEEYKQELNEKTKGETDAALLSLYKQQLTTCSNIIPTLSELENKKIVDILKVHNDVLGSYLDARKKGTITSDEMKVGARDIAKKYEALFFEDCDALGIRRPDIISRVTEFIPEIISFIQKIISNGFAYESNKSVYFDTASFRKAGMTYGRLNPNGVGKIDAPPKGEKRNENDFALWKNSKEGEPSWESPWGFGRPGWHIECSCMASDAFGDTLDIHSGGQDLLFPHHENELAQSEAYFKKQESWVRYFLHTGHLHINGLKMSKSLKNFVTIKQALEKYSAKQLRILFLMQSWDSIINYSDSALEEAINKEKTISEFLSSMRSALNAPLKGSPLNVADKEFMKVLEEKRAGIHNALCDNFDTSTAMNNLFALIRKCNDYLSPTASITLLKSAVVYIEKMLKVFGLEEKEVATTNNAPLLDVWTNFRTEVRKEAIKTKNNEILEICDRVRDVDLPKIGVRVEDAGKVSWKLGDPKEILESIAEKKRTAALQLLKKKENKRADLMKKVNNFKTWKNDPNEMFKDYPKPEKGVIPTVGINGEELGKKAIQKLDKMYKTAVKNNNTYKAEHQKDPMFLEKMIEQINQLDIEIKELH
ncbi:cysteine--tRNA ligase [Entamoeba marina]